MSVSSPTSPNESDFIDFYEMLGATDEATTTALRRRINELYTEAQTNRDHRNPQRRRYYEELVQILPYCRNILLDPDKRVQYDSYREKLQNGQSIPAFEDILQEVAGPLEAEGERGELGTANDDALLPVSVGNSDRVPTRPTRSPRPPREESSAGDDFRKPTARQPVRSNISVSEEETRVAQGRRKEMARNGMVGPLAALVAFVAVAIILVFLQQPIVTAILGGLVIALLVFIALNTLGNGGGRTKVQ